MRKERPEDGTARHDHFESGRAGATSSTASLPVLLAAMLLLAACSAPLAAQQAALEPEPIEAGIAAPPGPYAPGFDAIHYDISLQLPDEGTYVEATMRGRFRIVPPRRDTLSLDLTGLAVGEVTAAGRPAEFRYEDGKLHIAVPSTAGDTLDVSVAYSGHPDDGLILGRNLHGEPTAFADNWPNRARFWFPSIDHPSDKATVRFDVRIHPNTNRRVIANGALESDGARWSTTKPIPTYTMVVGAAEFVVDTLAVECVDGTCTDVTTWLFAPDAERGAESFRRAGEMVAFFSELIAPFPYEKLAHVQSSTRFGGMENVSAIFYPERPIAEGRNFERTVAHETAHQWFGDAVTEADWAHLWLSEGFASYFAALFFERADGRAALREIMDDYLEGYLESGAWTKPIVHREENLFDLLNANNYSKGAWVLHMLRHRLGDEAFFDGIRSYYREHEHGTALTADLRRAMEGASGDSLEHFFDQWLHRPGHPRLAVDWQWADGQATIDVRQIQPAAWPAFEFPLELAFDTPGGMVRQTVDVQSRRQQVHVAVPERPSRLALDPEGQLLKEIVVP